MPEPRDTSWDRVHAIGRRRRVPMGLRASPSLIWAVQPLVMILFVPWMEQRYQTLDLTLPAVTRLLIGLSDAIVSAIPGAAGAGSRSIVAFVAALGVLAWFWFMSARWTWAIVLVVVGVLLLAFEMVALLLPVYTYTPTI